MSPKARREYVADMRSRYAAATLVERRALLDEVVAMTGYHRKYAISLLGGPPRRHHRRRRVKRYGPTVLAALTAIWQAANYPWSTRLKAMLPLWLPWLEKRMQIDSQTREHLHRISARSIDRLLAPKRAQVQRRRNSLTRSAGWLVHQIPIRAERWDVSVPGWLEIDLVAHCGNSLGGEFIYSLNATDIATGWTETRAVMGKGQAGVIAALDDIRRGLPFPLLGIDSDSGSEFINMQFVRWCQLQKLHFTRSRPYKKNDNAHIEQKNYTNVRKIFGWLRFDSLAALEAMNALYKTELRIWMNYFQPSVKLVRKERIGSRVHKSYDAPLTPYQRLLSCAATATAESQGVDPFQLANRITAAITGIARMASTAAVPAPRPHGPAPPPLSKRAALVARSASKILVGATEGR